MLNNKYALITGSTSGIGLDIAKILAQNGCNIALNGFADENQTNQLLKLFENEYKVKAIFAKADLSNPDEIPSMINYIHNKFGKLDIIVNNAGIQHVDNIEDFPEEKWNAIIAINLSAAFHICKAAIPVMKINKWGRIINIASAHGLVASKKKAAYVAAKHGIIGFTKVAALENAGTGITCNAICPGWVLTPLVQKQIDDLAKNNNLSPEEAKKQLLLEKQPAGEFVKTEDIGNLVNFLCSDSAQLITGSSISIDGGWTAQ